MIPKNIHYCWFGNNKKPKIALRSIRTWESFRDYSITEWNESNCDIQINKYVKDAYDNKSWAHVSDYFRLKALYDNGGIYFDTDVKMFKDFFPFLQHDMFLGFMFDCNLGTAVIGARKNDQTIKRLLSLYENMQFTKSANNDLYTKWFLENKNLKLNNKKQELEGVTVYPKEFFECPTHDKTMGYSAHYFMGSWQPNKPTLFKKINKKIKLFLFGDVKYHKQSRQKALEISGFYPLYQQHMKEGSNE